ncbi:signal recognition particle-docking protein FtsY [Thermosyntropha sp.]|uniref:signal recognition particle-docking protein FtsY n=1 Tax=Thermosyntropha sp. TaxID=2740820 RepID=UPI0025E3502B|nr:signal recognition particle-docking protein FtsY [Thermosyntropha sp.]MBO8159435.1 signal recognition particle-docking protein FtsY [Thermosyntropha sp.]
MAFFDRFKGKKKTERQEEQREELREEAKAKVVDEEDFEVDEPVKEIVRDEITVEKETSEEAVKSINEMDEKGNKPSKKGLFDRFKKGLGKTRVNISDKIVNLVKTNKKLDEDFFEGLEDILIQADVGVETSLELVENIRRAAKKNKIADSSRIMELIKEEAVKILGDYDTGINVDIQEKPAVVLVVGVNGAGKTTSIAKLAYRFKQENKKVLLVAADTFRAAAIDQLSIWADRVGVEIIKHQEGADPGAVVFDALNAAKARKSDIVIIDTAGRLQNKTNLMKEISKVRKIIEREIPSAPHEVLLVVDATTGQNAVSQAKIFKEATGVSGIILTKLDGTAKGGIVLSISKELGIPVKMVGIGEGMEDLREFDPVLFAEALFNVKEE